MTTNHDNYLHRHISMFTVEATGASTSSLAKAGGKVLHS